MNRQVGAAMLLAAWLLNAGAFAASERSPAEKGEEILAGATEVLGGAKFLAVRDSVATGWLGTRSREVTRHIRAQFFEMYPDVRVWERQAFDRQGAHAVVFNASGGFEITFRGVRELAPDRVERHRDETDNNILHILRQWPREPSLVAEYRGQEVCEGQPGVLVDVYRAGRTSPVTVCFSQQSKLPVRQRYIRRDPRTKEPVEEVTVFARFQDIASGVRWPKYVAHWRDGMCVSEIFLETVSVNQGLPEDLFRIPEAATRLAPAPEAPWP